MFRMPKQNGIEKKKNYKLIDIMGYMLAKSTLLDFLLDSALTAIMYILNQVTSKSKPKTHYELPYKKKHSLRQFNV